MTNAEIMSFVARPASSTEAEVRVPTTTLLPDGGQVTVLVRRTNTDRFIVSDGGAAFEEILSLGHLGLVRGDTRKANEIAERLGLDFMGTEFSLKDVSPDQLMAAVAYVAEAARAWASEVMLAADQRRTRTIADQVGERLSRVFPARSIGVERELLGASNKRHRFDFVVDLASERHAVFEIVSTAPVSLASAHLKFYDIGQAHKDWPREAVAETLDDWNAEDVAVLSQVATHIRDLRSDWSNLRRLAA